MRKHPVVSVLLVTVLMLAALPSAALAAGAAPAAAERKVDSATGATPNYRTFQQQDLKAMPYSGGHYTILKNKPPYTYFEQDWYGVNLSYLLDVEVGLKAGTTGIKVIAADGYSVTLTPDEMRNANSQGLFAHLAWKKGPVGKTGGPYTELDSTTEGPFRLVTPQTPKTGPWPGGSPNWQMSVSMVRAIEIDPTPPGLLAVDPATVPSNQILVYGNILNRRSFTVDQLKSIKRFSGTYRWSKEGTTGTATCQGIPFDYLLENVAGLLPGASGVDVVASDGFKQSFTLEDVRLTPNGLPFLLAWNVDGPLTPEPGRGPIMTIVPQHDPKDGNREFWIRNVRVVQVKPLAAALAPDPARVPTDRILVCGQDPRNVPDFWYLAEGYTGGGFEEYICVGNPNSWETKVIVTYMIEGQENQESEFTMQPRSRTTINVNEAIGPDKNVSAMVEGYHGDSIIVERAMYWNGRRGGHCAAAVSDLSTEWYLAEGCTENAFETWILLQNPGDAAATANVTYMNAGGAVAGPAVSLPPRSRKTVNVAGTLPNDVQVSTRVTADQPIVAERSMYWNNRTAGTCAVGLSGTGTEWYLAEGSTGGPFETWILVQNPGDEAAKVDLTYMNAGGAKTGPVLNMPAHSRTTVNVATTLPGDWQVSTAITSDRPVVAERAVYWSNRAGGHAETAVDSPKFRSLLAEGSTAGGFETWVLLQNPGPSDADVYITYLTATGAKERAVLELPAGTRVSINELEDVGSDWQVSADVNASTPIVVERAMYWAGRDADGSCSHGYPTW